MTDVKSETSGIVCGESRIHCLLYADDLVLISENEDDLQNMLNVLEKWCVDWKMKANVNKTKVMHFRPGGREQTAFNFSLGNSRVDIVDTYKYLGIVMHYSLNYDFTAEMLSKSGSRALGAICSKFRNNKGLGYNTYKKSFMTGVAPILDYCSGVWGNGKLPKLDTVQNRAIRYFLGTHRFTPNVAINGECGWLPSDIRRKVEMVRLWNRLVTMPDNRLTKKVFLWDKDLSSKNWSSEIKRLLADIGLSEYFDLYMPVDLNTVKNNLYDAHCIKWKNDIVNVSKLKTLHLCKGHCGEEPYLSKVTNRQHRSVLAQFRCGILPLKIETGRFQNIPKELRLCCFCPLDAIEDELHFLFTCAKYNDLRNAYFTSVNVKKVTFDTSNEVDKLNILMGDMFVKSTAEYLWKCFNLRQNCLYAPI